MIILLINYKGLMQNEEDRRVRKTRSAIKSSFIELLNEKELEKLQFKILQIVQILIEVPFIYIMKINIYYYQIWKMNLFLK